MSNLESLNHSDDLETLWQDFVPGAYFNASVPLRIHLQGQDLNYVELVLGNKRRFAVVYFDTKRRLILTRGLNGAEIPLLVHPSDEPFPIGKAAFRHYKGFFGDIEPCISSNQCQVKVVGADKNSDRDPYPYPVIEILNCGRNLTFCRVFQKPSSQTPEA